MMTFRTTGRTLFLLPIIFSIFITACGGGGSGATTTTQPSVASTTTSHPSPTGGGAVTYNLTTSVSSGSATGSISPNPAGLSCGANCYTYDSGTSATLTATAAAGYTFSGWSGSGVSCPGTGACTVSMGANRTVTATFSQTTVSSSTYILTWDQVVDPNVTGYKLYYAAGPFSSGSQIRTIDVGTPTTYQFNPSALGLAVGTTIYFSVAAVGNGMESPLSDPVSMVLQ